MSDKQWEADDRVKKKVMGWRGFAISYSVMLLLVGIQTGIIVFPGFSTWSPMVQVPLIMGYWAIVAIVFAYIINYQIRQEYDNPMRKLSSAAKRVAEGDFSVYVEPIHTSDQYDYLDVMFVDFNKMVQELGSIETLKNDFVANVSHELKTPLAVINNYTHMLSVKDLPDNTREEYIKTIINATEKLSALITNILKLNKLDNQEIDVLSDEYNLCRQLCDCVLRFESLWEQKDIEFVVDVEEKATISADSEMLEIVWNNLISNALKFTPSGGTVSLIQTSEEDTVTITVSDTGCGMDEETQKHIFDKFYQGDTSHSGDGNGLGLALAHRVIEKLGGTISVMSEPGKGSTFTVILPLNYQFEEPGMVV
jgi:Signal transduction histidine kinase